MAASRVCVNGLKTASRICTTRELVRLQAPTCMNGMYKPSLQQLGFLKPMSQSISLAGMDQKTSSELPTLQSDKLCEIGIMPSISLTGMELNTSYELPTLQVNKFYKIGIIDQNMPASYKLPACTRKETVLEKVAPPLSEIPFMGDPVSDEDVVRKEARSIVKIRKRMMKRLHHKKTLKRNAGHYSRLRKAKKTKRREKLQLELKTIRDSAEAFDPWKDLMEKSEPLRGINAPSSYQDLHKRISKIQIR